MEVVKIKSTIIKIIVFLLIIILTALDAGLKYFFGIGLLTEPVLETIGIILTAYGLFFVDKIKG